jgi:putative sterol carrier protein
MVLETMSWHNRIHPRGKPGDGRMRGHAFPVQQGSRHAFLNMPLNTVAPFSKYGYDVYVSMVPFRCAVDNVSSNKINEKLNEMLPQIKFLSGSIRFDLGDGGLWLLDAREKTACFSPDDGESDVECTIQISADNLSKLLDGKLDPMLAYGLGKIKVKGSMGLALKLVSALG